MGHGRSCNISKHLDGQTGANIDTNRRGEKNVVIQEDTCNHVIFHFTHGGKKAQDLAGAAIIIPKDDKALIQTVECSNDAALRGRVGYFRIAKKDTMDITFITV
jgi:hypothetical protein